jgi:hypothetical protein
MSSGEGITNASGMSLPPNCFWHKETIARAHREIMQALSIPAELLQGESSYSSARLDVQSFPPQRLAESRSMIIRQ